MKEFKITKNDAGQRLDRFISKAVPLLPSSLMQKYIRTKRIKINGKPAKRDDRLCPDDLLQLYIGDEFFDKTAAAPDHYGKTGEKPQIIYEDDNILLVDKKPGVVCHGEKDEESGTLIYQVSAYLAQKGEWDPKNENSFAPALCNRIDRNTGGIVIAAKTAEALRIINLKIKEREVDKRYLCAVLGRPAPERGVLTGYIFKDAVKNRVYVRKNPVTGAKPAKLEYKTLVPGPELSLVECRLITGRTHQIRAQMADFGHPVLGDGKYGSERRNKAYKERYQALYSYKLAFFFKTESGVLEYLNGKSFTVGKIGFAEKYFNYDFR
ncbi:MAG: RluA family pseudouridine synthase [Oscillospiraceae bacterium]|nr:RluA family pseudouridine synthase [Oscillospiraceae bacterium]